MRDTRPSPEGTRPVLHTAGITDRSLGALVEDYLAVVVGSAATGRSPSGPEIERCRDLGGTAARRGQPLASLVDACLSATARLWPRLPGVPGVTADPMRLGEAVLKATDLALSALAEGHAEAQRLLLRDDEVRRGELVDDLLGGGADLTRLVDSAERFGLRLAAAHVVLAGRTDRAVRDASPVVAAVDGLLRRGLPGDHPLVAARDGLLVAVLPAAAVAAAGGVGRLADEVAAAVPREVPGWTAGRPWSVGVGRPHPGPRGASRSYREAREALALATRLDLQSSVAHAERLLVYRVLLRDEAAMADLVHAVLSPLAAAHTGPRPLLDTLAEYFACGGVAAEAARRLYLSVRAVTYRLARVRDLTGYDPTDPEQRFTLEVAVAGARLLGWPEEQPVSAD